MTPGFRPFEVPAVGAFDRHAHRLAVGLNLLLVAGGIGWLLWHWQLLLPGWYGVLAGMALGLFLGDFLSGLLHWAFDTWFDEKMGTFERVVVIVREHHVYPQNIFKYRFLEELGPNSWASIGFTAPIYAIAACWPAPGPWPLALVVACLVIALCLLFMLQFHKLGHQRAESPLIRRLQALRLVMSPQHHGQHHRANHDIRYCLINGWADLVCDRIGFWRRLERLLASATGATPRASDHDWMRRYGRRRE